MVSAARRRPGDRGGDASPGHPARRPRRHPRADEPTARHCDPGVLARRSVRGRAAAPDADGLDRRVRRADADPHPKRGRGAAAARPRPRAVLRGGRGRSAVGAAARSHAGQRSAESRRATSAVPDDLDRLAILQFTSGSTSEPKGVMLPQRVLCSNLDAIEKATALDYEVDVLVSWLPLYHDMGLVGCMTTPMTTGAGLVLGVTAGLPRSPGRVDGVDLDLQGHGDRGAELLVGARHAGAEADERARSVADAHRAERRGADRSRRGRSVRRRGEAARLPPGRASSARSAWPRSRSPAPSPRRCAAWCATSSTARVLETEKVAKPVDRDDENARRLAVARHSRAGTRDPCVRSADRHRAGRARSRRARDPGHVGDAGVLQAARRHGRAVPRRVAAHRRPRLHARR